MESCNWIGDVINFLQFIIKNLAYPSIETSRAGNYSQMKATDNMQKLFMVHHIWKFLFIQSFLFKKGKYCMVSFYSVVIKLFPTKP